MKKTNYFKNTFLPLAAGLTVGLFAYGLLTTDFDTELITKNLLKSVTVGVVTALILALLNSYFKITPFKKKQ